ncbi:LuxR family transcriptional regulator [soil metagenome]
MPRLTATTQFLTSPREWGYSRAIAGDVMAEPNDGSRGIPIPVVRTRRDGANDESPRLGHPTPFVGRVDELDVLRRCVDAPAAQGGLVVLVEGEAGSGKSVLVRHALDERADDSNAGRGVGSARWTASAMPDEQQIAFGVVDQLASGDVHVVPGRANRDPLELGAALVERLGDLAATGDGVVLVVEDVQWADRQSLHALSFALRRLQGDAVTAVLTSRPPAPDAVTRMLGTVNGTRIDLAAFTVDEVRSLADALGLGPIPSRAAHRLWEHTGGLPLHVKAVCTEIGAERLVELERPLPVPRSFALMVAAQMASCPPDAAELVAAVAVLGGQCGLARAVAVADIADPATALDGGVAAGLLEHPPEVVGWEIQTIHPLVTSAVVEHLPPASRRGLHLRAAENTTEADTLRHRALAAVGPDPTLANETDAYARVQLADHRVSESAHLLLRAARLTPLGDTRGHRLLEAIVLLLADGDVGAAFAHEAEIAAMSPTARRALVLGQLAYFSGRQADAASHLEQGWHLREQSTPEVTVRTAIWRGHLALLQAEATEACTWGGRALETAEDESGARVEAAALIAIAQGMLGHGRRVLDTLADTPVRADRPEHLEALLARGIVSLWSGDLPAAEDALAQVSEGTVPWRPLHLRLSALGCRAKAGYRMGRFDASRAHAELAVSLARDSDHRWALSFLSSIATLVPAVRGDWSTARDHAAVAAAAADDGGGLATDRAYAAHAAAQLAFAQDDSAGVIAAIEPVLELLQRDGYAEPGVMPWRELYAEALARGGRHVEADRVVRQIEQAATERGHPLASASAMRARGHVLAAQGDGEAAVASFDAAARALDGIEARFEIAVIHDARGRALRRLGHRRQAAEAFSAALETFRALGAEPFVVRAEREAAACGLSPRRRDTGRAMDLTPQELAVAAMAARGDTNREIAGELIVSVKTVEYHLGNVFSKLGIHSRRELRHHLDR